MHDNRLGAEEVKVTTVTTTDTIDRMTNQIVMAAIMTRDMSDLIGLLNVRETDSTEVLTVMIILPDRCNARTATASTTTATTWLTAGTTTMTATRHMMEIAQITTVEISTDLETTMGSTGDLTTDTLITNIQAGVIKKAPDTVAVRESDTTTLPAQTFVVEEAPRM